MWISLRTESTPDAAPLRWGLPGNTPEAVRYLAETKAQPELIVVDGGPADVDTSEITNYGPLKGRATRRVRLGADPK
ncbi:MAG: hypothetical protein ABIU29_03615 [Chthoniobacterales bacterium]